MPRNPDKFVKIVARSPILFVAVQPRSQSRPRNATLPHGKCSLSTPPQLPAATPFLAFTRTADQERHRGTYPDIFESARTDLSGPAWCDSLGRAFSDADVLPEVDTQPLDPGHRRFGIPNRPPAGIGPRSGARSRPRRTSHGRGFSRCGPWLRGGADHEPTFQFLRTWHRHRP
jgi:hypothetical protein